MLIFAEREKSGAETALDPLCVNEEEGEEEVFEETDEICEEEEEEETFEFELERAEIENGAAVGST